VLQAELDKTLDEARLEALCAQINELARKINTLGTNAIASGVVGVDIDEQRVRLAERRKFNPCASS
jgi:hypothetical protein